MQAAGELRVRHAGEALITARIAAAQASEGMPELRHAAMRKACRLQASEGMPELRHACELRHVI
jgi:hypothetical protein